MPPIPYGPELHILSHFVVPVAVARVGYRGRWRVAALIMIATMIVDLDHLLATPVYDPQRCSIDFHPLHSTSAIVVYALLCAVPPVAWRRRGQGLSGAALALHLVGLGLVIHMALDGADCLM